MRTSRRFLRSLCFLLLSFPPLWAETLTITTYNIENYGPADRMTEEGFRPHYPKPEAEKQALRAVIHALNADVLALQEMGAAPYLAELQHDLRAEGLDYPFAALGVAADVDRHTALLSRRPLSHVITHADLEFSYFGAREKVKRGLLEATLAATGGEVTLFVVHLKSRFSDRPDDPLSARRRAGEATAVRDRILRRFPSPASARFVLVGDCNDGGASRPLQHLLKRGALEIVKLLPAADGRGEFWTHRYLKDESYSRLDNILVMGALFGAVEGGRAQIYDGPEVMKASDHRPVVVRLVL